MSGLLSPQRNLFYTICMPHPLVTILGKTVRRAARMRGGGSALPGLFVERLDPNFVSSSLAQLPRGVIVISGTNGKTTTTKIAVELLESQGLRVFTNRTGSNFTRGVAAALLGEINLKGELHADIAVLELDEAHAVHFVRTVQPRATLLLNVMRDQLDRFGEIDATAKLLEQIAAATSEHVVINREDPRLRNIGRVLSAGKVSFFGLDDTLLSLFPSDDDMRSTIAQTNTPPPPARAKATAVLHSVNGRQAVFDLHGKQYDVTMKLGGVYNVFNMVAAVSLVAAVLGDDLKISPLLKTVQSVTPAFGRGETLVIGGQPLELVLVKNPSGFRLGLSSFDPIGYNTMIAINDNYADGRDMSWLWDVEFESLRDNGVSYVSGLRGYDMALRLQYDEVAIGHVEPNLATALRGFIEKHANTPKRIYCTYTAMLSLRRELAKITTVDVVS